VKTLAATLVALLLMVAPGFARAQRQPALPGGDLTVGPAELQKLFDSYALVQAQQFLAIPDEQYTKFLARFIALQTARRQALQQHTRGLNQLRKALNDGSADDQISSAMKQLQEIDERGVSEARKALEGVDQVLDLRQQARFRVFEEQMERRKLELVTRARQANRGARQ
jgi:hypothetical protein